MQDGLHGPPSPAARILQQGRVRRRAGQGGTLCTNGKWRAADGSASGTTPFRVFIKDGVKRRSP
jgi:hypothetical protein